MNENERPEPPEDEGRPSDEEIMAFLENLVREEIDQAGEGTLIVNGQEKYTVVGGATLHPENIPPSHDYVVTLTFSTRDSREQVSSFIEEVMKLMPNGTRSDITTSGEVISVADLDWGHVGSTIRIFVEGRTVEGKLEAIYTTGVGSGISQTLIIDGKAWSLSFGVAELNV